MKNMKNLAIALILTLSLLVTAGCGNDAPAPDNTPDSTEPGTSVVTTTDTEQTNDETTTAETTTGTTTTADRPDKPEETVDPMVSLNALRQSIANSYELAAVAYLGCTEDMNEVDPIAWMKENCPSFCKENPFATAVDRQHIVGKGFGELYCIVPTDPNATVAVNGAVMHGEVANYETVFYRSEVGAPILLLCNNGGFDPDTQVIITDSNGVSTTWYPRLDDCLMVQKALNENDDNTVKDFTPYGELLQNEYSKHKQNGLAFPTAQQLVGTTWHGTDYTDDGRTMTYALTFNETTVDIRWNDGIDVEDHEYEDASWELTCDKDVALLTMDFREFAGEMTYALLLDKTNGYLYTWVDFVEDRVQDYCVKTKRILQMER